MSQQPALAIKKMYGVPECLRQSIASRLRIVILPLYSALLRSHMGCCVQFRAPEYKRDVDVLERVQWRTMKMIKGLDHLLCEERLKELGLFSLEKRMLRGNSSMRANTWREGIKATYTGSFQRCSVTVQEAMGANRNTGSSIPTSGTLFDLEGDQVLAQVGQGVV